jgi:hypothetical protein
MALTPKGYEQIVSPAASTALTVPAGSTCALIQAQDADIRWRDDGTDPTASVGEKIIAEGDIWVEGAARLAAFRVIRTVAGADVNVSYYA